MTCDVLYVVAVSVILLYLQITEVLLGRYSQAWVYVIRTNNVIIASTMVVMTLTNGILIKQQYSMFNMCWLLSSIDETVPIQFVVSNFYLNKLKQTSIDLMIRLMGGEKQNNESYSIIKASMRESKIFNDRDGSEIRNCVTQLTTAIMITIFTIVLLPYSDVESGVTDNILTGVIAVLVSLQIIQSGAVSLSVKRSNDMRTLLRGWTRGVGFCITERNGLGLDIQIVRQSAKTNEPSITVAIKYIMGLKNGLGVQPGQGGMRYEHIPGIKKALRDNANEGMVSLN